MNNKIKYFVLLFVLLIFSISCAHAVNETDVASTDDSVSVPDAEVSKVISKTNIEDNVVKTANVTEVSSYAALDKELTTKETDKVVNLKKGTYTIVNPIKMYDKGTKNLVLNGNGAIIDGSSSKSFLTIYSNNKVTINDLVIRNTKGTDLAGGIVVVRDAKLTLNNCNFTNDVSTNIGGAITNMGTLTVNNCVFTSNTAKLGAAIWSTGEYKGTLTIQNSKFIKNRANYQDNYDKTAVVYVITGTGGKTNILNNVFENNNGRSIHAFKANTLISGNTFKNIVLKTTTQTIRGAVIDNYEANMNIINNVFTNISIPSKNVKGGLLYNEIGTSTFEDNKISGLTVTATEKTDSLNGGIIFNRNSSLTVRDNTVVNSNTGYRVHGGDLYNNMGKLYVYSNKFTPTNKASYLIRGKYIYNDNKGVVNYGGNNFDGSQTNIYNNNVPNAVKQVAVPIVKKATTITVNQVHGVIGDSITFTANVKDSNGAAVTGGNVVFKLNGKTLKTDGTFNAASPSNKISVTNGVAKITVTATKDIRGAKNISASYSGSDKYNASTTKGITTAEITLRKAALTVSVSPSTQKQYEVIKFTAKITDVTKNTKSKVPANNAASYVFFKVNGITLKDANGKQVKAKINNGVATYDYKVPAGMSAIGKDKKIRYYNVTAGFVHPNYYPDTKNVTKFNVLRSNVTITTTKAVANMTSHKLQVVGTIKDLKNKNVIGTSKLSVKINGKTMPINGNATMDVTDGKFSVTVNIPDSVELVREVTLVTGARTAYEGCRTTISNITRV